MAERAERERHYQRLAGEAARDEAAHATRSRTYSRIRLALFLGATAALIAGALGRAETSRPLVLAAVTGYAAFAAAVFRHARIEADRAHAAARRECAEISLARMARQWDRLPAVDVRDAAASGLADERSGALGPPGARRPGGVQGSPPNIEIARASDLDLDGAASLMSLIGSLTSTAGQRVLRGWLNGAPETLDIINARQEGARALARSADFREAFTTETRLYVSRRDDARARERFLAWAEGEPSAFSRGWVRLVLRVWTAAILTCIAAAVAGGTAPPPWSWLWAPLALGAFVFSVLSAKWVHAELDAASIGPSALANIVALVRLAESLPARAISLDAIRERLARPSSAAHAFAVIGRRVGWSELRSAPVLHLPVQALTLWDFHVLFALDDWRAAHGRHAREWWDALAELDAFVALGTLAHDEPCWTFPAFDGETPRIEARALGHPLLADSQRVPNDVTVGPPGTVLLVTGSNMAGKSTLLRAIGTNVMLANAGAPVCARALSLARLQLATSLRTSDSLAQGVSGYMAGLVRLKEVVDEVDRATAARDRAVLYLLDEILGGTNSEERRLAVREIAAHLLESYAIGAMTTHDLALADEPTLQRAAVRVHFRETVEPASEGDARMTFDYVLRPGLATSTNAIALLRAIGLAKRGA